LDFANWYIDDIIVFNSTMEEHGHHLQDVFKRLMVHGFKLHPRKFRFFQSQVEYLSHMIYPWGLGVQKAEVDMISKIH
jgi:hypothetical protein